MGIPLLVGTPWLQDNLSNPNIEVLENAWIKDAYSKAHIDGAFCVPGHPYLKSIDSAGERTNHVMQTDEFTELCEQLGLCQNKHYIVYDDYYGLFAARFWYVCRHFGLNNISILNGSWRGWLAEGGRVASLISLPEPKSDILPKPDTLHMVGLNELLSIYDSPDTQLWDTRRIGEFNGEEETANRRKGHIPGALNLVWTDLLTESTYEGGARYLKPITELRQIIGDLGLCTEKTIITYCQSGNRAAFCNFVLELLGFPQHRLYDASMSEWANHAETPLVKGSPFR